jgi:hypothetical protein
LEEDGYFHLKKMKETGEIEEGDHEHPAGVNDQITTGKATDDKFITLTTRGGFVYEGELIPSPGATLIIVGRRHRSLENVPKVPQGTAQGVLDQDDPPWVITKP